MTSDFTELVVICCHAICLDPDKPYAENSWLLQSFQRSDPHSGKPGEHETFIQHIQAARQCLNRSGAMVMFSGGATSPATEKSESESYLQVMCKLYDVAVPTNNWLMYHTAEVKANPLSRVRTERYATDSYQNLLFSIIAFYKETDAWPQMVTVITHAFKQDRFLKLHAPAIGWSSSKIRVQGINPPFTEAELADVSMSEKKTMNDFANDPHGLRPPLSSKRVARRWKQVHAETMTMDILDKQVACVLDDLLGSFDGASGKGQFAGPLPWQL